MRLITFEGVHKTYPDGTSAVVDLNMEIPTGKITVLAGPSGCGKTTSLRMVNRMVGLTRGRISIDGADITRQDPADLRRSIGYVIQQGGLFPHRTVAHNIMTVPLLMGQSRKQLRPLAMGLLEKVGLSASLADKYPAKLSGGQAQRVGVARALAADPPILLMDEPFSAVDPVVRTDLHAEFLRLQEELGKTIVLVTHDIDEAIKLGDFVAIFKEGGRLAQFAAPQDLLMNPADDFVATFIGRDRGYRSLSFEQADALRLEPAGSPIGGHVLELDGSGRPVGWRGDSGARRLTPLRGTFSRSDSLRHVMDLVIGSPVGAAVCVDADGRALGFVSHPGLIEGLGRRRVSSEAVS